MFSILVPTWNNLEYLKLCVMSIRKNSALPYQLLVHVNEGTDGTREWLESEAIQYTFSDRNLGVCMSLNEVAMHATQPWIAYLNDDMYCCPGWDTAFRQAIDESPTDLALYSARLIEPFPSKFPFVDCFDAGRTPADFDEAALLAATASLPSLDVDGEGSQPTVISRLWWHRLGGYAIEYSPGMCSDDDLLLKLWAVGCRRFKVAAEHGPHPEEQGGAHPPSQVGPDVQALPGRAQALHGRPCGHGRPGAFVGQPPSPRLARRVDPLSPARYRSVRADLVDETRG